VVAHEADPAVRVLEPVRGWLHDVRPVPRRDERVDEVHLELHLLLACGTRQEDPVELPQHLRGGRVVERGFDVPDSGRQVLGRHLHADHGRRGGVRVAQLLDQALIDRSGRLRHQDHRAPPTSVGPRSDHHARLSSSSAKT
jgi:hypothetical protein